MVKLGRAAIDSTRIAANASKDRVDSEQALRDTRARLRRQVRAWQKAADRDDAEPGGMEVAIDELNRALAEMPRRLERLKKSGLKKLSRPTGTRAFCASAETSSCSATRPRSRSRTTT